MDVEAAFDSYISIKRAATSKGMDEASIRWMRAAVLNTCSLEFKMFYTTQA